MLHLSSCTYQGRVLEALPPRKKIGPTLLGYKRRFRDERNAVPVSSTVIMRVIEEADSGGGGAGFALRYHCLLVAHVNMFIQTVYCCSS